MTSVVFQSNDRLASTSADGTVKVWQNWWNAKYDQAHQNDEATVATLNNYHKGCVNAVQVNSFLMITAGSDNMIKVSNFAQKMNL